MYKTIAQIAKENNITTQALYKRYQRFNDELTWHVHKQGKTITLDSEGEKLLLRDLPVGDGCKPVGNQDNSSIKPDDEPFSVFLQEQIHIKDDLIKSLVSQTNDLIEKLSQCQVLLKHEQERSTFLIEMSKNTNDNVSHKNKKSLFKRLFSR